MQIETTEKRLARWGDDSTARCVCSHVDESVGVSDGADARARGKLEEVRQGGGMMPMVLQCECKRAVGAACNVNQPERH